MNILFSMFCMIRSDWITPLVNSVMAVLVVMSIIFRSKKIRTTSFRLMASAWCILALTLLVEIVHLSGTAEYARLVIEDDEWVSPYIFLSPLWFWAVSLFRITGGGIICMMGIMVHSFLEWWPRRRVQIEGEAKLYVFLISIGMLVFIVGLRGIAFHYGEGILWGKERSGERRSIELKPIELERTKTSKRTAVGSGEALGVRSGEALGVRSRFVTIGFQKRSGGGSPRILVRSLTACGSRPMPTASKPTGAGGRRELP